MTNKPSKKESVFNSLIIRWNKKYPYDYWWRKKHGIPFGSRAHREVSPFDIAFEFYEEKMFNELMKKEEGKTKNTELLKDKENLEKILDNKGNTVYINKETKEVVLSEGTETNTPIDEFDEMEIMKRYMNPSDVGQSE